MTDNELFKLKTQTAELQAQAVEDAKRIERVGQSLDSHIARNHWAELLYESMRRKESNS